MPTTKDIEDVLGSLPSDDDAVKPKPATIKAPKVPAKGTLQRRLHDMFTNMGAGLMFVDPVCGKVITQQAGDLAEAFENLARENARIRKWLEVTLEGGAWGGVAMACFPIFITVAAHHGKLNPEIAAAAGISVPIPVKKQSESPNGKGIGVMEDVVPIS